MKKRLNLEELELRLPIIDEKNSKILLGGSDYDGADDEACRFCAQLTFGEGRGSGGQEHNDYGDNFDLDASIDGVHDYDGNNDADGGGGNGSNIAGYTGGVKNNMPESFFNGANLAQYPISGGMDLGDFNTTFIQQFNTILESNTVIAAYLDNIQQLGIPLSFNIGEISNFYGDTVNAQTISHAASHSVDITFNIDQMTPDAGWTNSSNGSNPVVSLVQTILHEILHAHHSAIVMSTQQSLVASHIIPNNDNVYNALVASQGAAFAQIFFQFNQASGSYEPIGTGLSDDERHQMMNAAEHAYMSTYAPALYQAAQQEFNNDIASLQSHVDGLEQSIAQAAANLGHGVDPDGGQGSGPTNADFQQTYNNLNYELWDLLQNYGWMLP